MADFPMDPNLVIDDHFVERVVGRPVAYHLRCVDENYKKYIEILEKVNSLAVISGDTAEALQEFIVCAKELSGFLTDYGQQLRDTCESYISEINIADDYLF